MDDPIIQRFHTYLQDKEKLIEVELSKIFNPSTNSSFGHHKYPIKLLKLTQTKFGKQV